MEDPISIRFHRIISNEGNKYIQRHDFHSPENVIPIENEKEKDHSSGVRMEDHFDAKKLENSECIVMVLCDGHGSIPAVIHNAIRPDQDDSEDEFDFTKNNKPKKKKSKNSELKNKACRWIGGKECAKIASESILNFLSEADKLRDLRLLDEMQWSTLLAGSFSYAQKVLESETFIGCLMNEGDDDDDDDDDGDGDENNNNDIIDISDDSDTDSNSGNDGNDDNDDGNNDNSDNSEYDQNVSIQESISKQNHPIRFSKIKKENIHRWKELSKSQIDGNHFSSLQKEWFSDTDRYIVDKTATISFDVDKFGNDKIFPIIHYIYNDGVTEVVDFGTTCTVVLFIKEDANLLNKTNLEKDCNLKDRDGKKEEEYSDSESDEDRAMNDENDDDGDDSDSDDDDDEDDYYLDGNNDDEKKQRHVFDHFFKDQNELKHTIENRNVITDDENSKNKKSQKKTNNDDMLKDQTWVGYSKLIVANSGDSDVYLYPVDQDIGVRLTEDHSVNNKSEVERMKSFGVHAGSVYFTLEDGPFAGRGLMPSRSLCHPLLKEYGFTDKPSVTFFPSLMKGDCIVAGSDGLWNSDMTKILNTEKNEKYEEEMQALDFMNNYFKERKEKNLKTDISVDLARAWNQSDDIKDNTIFFSIDFT